MANSDQTFTVFGVANFFHQGGTFELEQKKITGLYLLMKNPLKLTGQITQSYFWIQMPVLFSQLPSMEQLTFKNPFTKMLWKTDQEILLYHLIAMLTHH